MESIIEVNLMLSAFLFTIGLLGVVWKRNAISIFMSVELMLNAANLAFATFAFDRGLMSGGILILFIMTVAAAEAGAGLAIFIRVFRSHQNIRADEMDLLRG